MTDSTLSYEDSFFEALRDGALRSAEVVVPLVMSLLAPRTVIDVGCGLGTWLKVFEKCGIRDFIGLDGDYVSRGSLEIPTDRFISWDLRTPIVMERRFDLAVSLEVAEHLPEESSAQFIESLTNLAPLVLFSAAIPDQGGQDHVNEQWPEFWAHLFRQQDFVPVDCFRRRIWDDASIEWWYRQNLLLFGLREEVDRHPLLKREARATGRVPMALVHPELFRRRVEFGW